MSTNVERVLYAMPGPLEFCRMLGIQVPRGARPDRFRVCCPWHNERNPACDITSRHGRIVAYCHSCHEGGDGFSLAAAVWGLSTATDFPEVLQRLADMFGVRLEEAPSPRERRDPVRDLMAALDALADEINLHGEVRPQMARYLAMVEAADPEQREEACRRLDALYDAEREARAKAKVEATALDRQRDDALGDMADDVLRAIARREAAEMKRMRLTEGLAEIEAMARKLAVGS